MLNGIGAIYYTASAQGAATCVEKHECFGATTYCLLLALI